MRNTKQFILKILLMRSNIRQRVNIFVKKNIFRQFEKHFINEFNKKVNKYNLKSVNFKQSGILMLEWDDIKYFINFLPSDHVEQQIYLNGVHQPEIARLMDAFLKNTTGIMIDIGANVGASTIPLAIKHLKTQFYCYEPHPDVFNKLKSNIQLNKLKNVELINSAVSDSKNNSLIFYAQKNATNMGKSSLKMNRDIEQYDEIKVSIENIDTNFANNKKDVILIKIDTQGTEPEVLRSCIQTIKKHRPVIFFEFEDRYYSDAQKNEEKIFLKNFFNDLNYSLLNISENTNYYPSIDITKNYHGDILAIPLNLKG